MKAASTKGGDPWIKIKGMRIMCMGGKRKVHTLANHKADGTWTGKSKVHIQKTDVGQHLRNLALIC